MNDQLAKVGLRTSRRRTEPLNQALVRANTILRQLAAIEVVLTETLELDQLGERNRGEVGMPRRVDDHVTDAPSFAKRRPHPPLVGKRSRDRDELPLRGVEHPLLELRVHQMTPSVR